LLTSDSTAQIEENTAAGGLSREGLFAKFRLV